MVCSAGVEADVLTGPGQVLGGFGICQQCAVRQETLSADAQQCASFSPRATQRWPLVLHLDATPRCWWLARVLCAPPGFGVDKQGQSTV
jgi:hypothetical protein